jgi:hypothetical protein
MTVLYYGACYCSVCRFGTCLLLECVLLSASGTDAAVSLELLQQLLGYKCVVACMFVQEAFIQCIPVVSNSLVAGGVYIGASFLLVLWLFCTC